jgi:predicted XRE-type DNA-binding protein
MKNKKTEVLNVFADLGLPDHEERVAKAELAMQINDIIKKRKLAQKEAAELLEIDQPKISALHKGKLAGFSLERLFRFLNKLGQLVTIKISPKPRKNIEQNLNISITKTRITPLKTTPSRPAMLARKKRSK